MFKDTTIDAASKEITRYKNKIKAVLKLKKDEKKRASMLEYNCLDHFYRYIEGLRHKNPNVYYPDSLAEGTMQDIIKYDIKEYQKQQENKGKYDLTIDSCKTPPKELESPYDM